MNQTGTDSELQRRLELLAGKALGDLTDQEQMDVDELLQERQWQSELWQLEATAAAVDLRLRSEQPSPMPNGLIQAIQKDAAAFFRFPDQAVAPTFAMSVPPLTQELPPADSVMTGIGSTDTSNSGGFTANAPKPNAPTLSPSGAAGMLSGQITPLDQQSTELAPQAGPVAQSSLPSRRREWLGWIACAASLLLAFGLWNANRPMAASSAAAQRATLLASAADIVQIDWAAGTAPLTEKVDGDVVWSTQAQAGFMRFRGLPVNDPTTEQYQLWIIDPERDERPIDGGVFDITEAGEVIVSIHAKLRVIDPKAFAITIEQPGGVVVSDQSRLPLLAAVE